jgi:hypothetical protein
MAQVVENLLCKCEALSSNSSPIPPQKIQYVMNEEIYTKNEDSTEVSMSL